MTTKLLSILFDYEGAYEMFESDHVNDTQVYQEMLSKVVDYYDILEVNEAYFKYINWVKENKPDEVEYITLIFKNTINMMPYRDISTGLILPLFEIMYLLRIGYTMDAVIKTVSVSPKSVEPLISDKRCEAICLSLLYPTRSTNVDLNSIHIENETLDMTGPRAERETFIDEERTIVRLEEEHEERIRGTVYTEVEEPDIIDPWTDIFGVLGD